MQTLAAHFAPIAEALAASEADILSELAAVQGPAADLGGTIEPTRKRQSQ